MRLAQWACRAASAALLGALLVTGCTEPHVRQSQTPREEASSPARAGDSEAGPTEPTPAVAAQAPPTPPDAVTVESGDRGPVFTISFWKRETLPQEPIWTRIAVRNPTESEMVIVPPRLHQSEWPLTFSVAGSDGNPVANESSTGPWYGLRIFGGPGWWSRERNTSMPHRPITLAPGEERFTWDDLLRHYMIDAPGRYHIVFDYAPDAKMITDAEAPELTWCGTAQLDAGWVTVNEPNRSERAAADLILAYRESEMHVLSVRGPEYPGEAVIAAAPRSDYVQHVEFVQAWYDTVYAAKPQDGLVERFLADHPDFPLAYQFGVATAMGRYRKAAQGVGYCRVTLRSGAFDGTLSAADAADLQEKLDAWTPELDAARDAMMEAAGESGDFDLYQRAEAEIWYEEVWRHWEPLPRRDAESDASPPPTKSGR